MTYEIEVDSLRKIYRVPVRESGLFSAFKSLFRPEFNEVPAVDGIGFKVREGEILGFLGPNGAGKTTTLKMLSGLLHPTEGKITVAGFTPWERKRDFLRCISMVMGNKGQLTWENTVMDSFTILKEIYGVSSNDFKLRLDELVELLGISGLLPKLPRNLSLGERAKCEFAAALLHCPRVLFLDEPSLGLDISVQIKLREFIREYNRVHGTTIILTSHYMTDITALCSRVLLIHTGKLIFDGALSELARQVSPFKLVNMSLGENQKVIDDASVTALGSDVTVLEKNGRRFVLRVNKNETPQVVSSIMNRFDIVDLTIEDSPIDNIIDEIYGNPEQVTEKNSEVPA